MCVIASSEIRLSTFGQMVASRQGEKKLRRYDVAPLSSDPTPVVRVSMWAKLP